MPSTPRAGYSKRSLVDKLGIKTGSRVYFSNAPPDYAQTLGDLPPGCSPLESASSSVGFIQHFSRERCELEKTFPRLARSLSRDGMLWISWPKRASKIATDLDENVVREIGLANGLVDVKVCAIDETWSGLKFVYRLANRK
jgi:hypothetical protein